MSSINHLKTLCDALAKHERVTHWAISARIFKRGDFFDRLGRLTPKRRRPVTCSAESYDQAMIWFSENWPEDLPWPDDVPRRAPAEDAA